MLSSTVTPSGNLEPYLIKHLESVAADAARGFSQIAARCLDALKKNKARQRKSPPSMEEVAALEANQIRQLPVKMPDGNIANINLDPHALTRDIVKMFCERWDIKRPEHFDLKLTYEPGSFRKSLVLCSLLLLIVEIVPLTSDEILEDGLQNAVKLMESYNQVAKLESTSYQTWFCRKLWFPDEGKVSDAAMNILFHQVFKIYQSQSQSKTVDCSTIFKRGPLY